ncbi:patatin-like phospholipase family protein [Meridianimarinicoccus sp. RP-17]|uniref:patatin-like phospholipase family protein n=1 Tax=Meridianimarinicoccus zhengii TaxID=2056810 RepID=UPI000DAC996A|nr:patatin-like phospholipase family protein [Phycocomes zhengii]
MATPKRINLALQGGGAHGAFTWGALKAILRDPDIEIAAITGTSAGALNGAAVKSGLASAEGQAGRQAAIANLDWLWRQIGAVNDMRFAAWLNAIFPDPAIVSRSIEYSLPFAIADAASRMVSPYAYGPFYSHPLRRIVDRFDFGRVCGGDGPMFFVNTTRVRNGKVRVFRQDEVTTDVILASACLPTIFQAVPIYDTETRRDEEFWDGGYTGNPALFPLFRPDLPEDILVININPLEREDPPRTPTEIQNRINEISFNSSLLRELRAISFVKRMLADGRLDPEHFRNPRVHMIADDPLMNDLSVATKTVPAPYILGRLRDAGEAAAARFLAAHRADLNERETIDLAAMFA